MKFAFSRAFLADRPVDTTQQYNRVKNSELIAYAMAGGDFYEKWGNLCVSQR